MGLPLSPPRWVIAQVIIYLALCSSLQCGIPKTLSTIPEDRAITVFREAPYVTPEAFYRPGYVTPEINPGSRVAIAKNKIVDAFFKEAKKGRAPSIWEIKHVKEKLVPDAIQEIFSRAQQSPHSDETINALIEGLEKSLMGKAYTPNILKAAIAFQQGLLSLSTRTWKDSSKMADTIESMLQRNGDYIRQLRRNDRVGEVLQSTLGTSEMLDHKLSPNYATVDGLGKNIEFDRGLSEILQQIRKLAEADSPRSASLYKQIPKQRTGVPISRVVSDFKSPSARPQTLIKQLREILSPRTPVSFQTKTAALLLLHHTAHWHLDQTPRILTDHSEMLELRFLAANALKHLSDSEDHTLIFPDHRALINASLK
ncbi:hypothetical protein PGT21_011673 [Puccinia graminis f. sp. tritici]|uniref:Uncharacterized protein n=1 Tax=Puccinia graminis f. sp. tritici TaxID=56615 RepID=A0A5B0LKS3_PUCGR|nr:hypothetical protein PGT21_011673 [Puccinia graminis f. sp. tritici]